MATKTNDDRSITITLSDPIAGPDGQITELKLRRPKAKGASAIRQVVVFD